MLRNGQLERSDSTSPRQRAIACSPARERGVNGTDIFEARETGDRGSTVRSRGLGCLFDSEPTVTLSLHCGLHDAVRWRGLVDSFCDRSLLRHMIS